MKEGYGADKAGQVMIEQKAFLYLYRGKPGVGALAQHRHEGWERVNLYAFGVDMDHLQGFLEGEEGLSLIDSGILAARAAQSRVLIAGGVVLKGLTCLAGENRRAEDVVSALERKVPEFKVVRAGEFREPDTISPLEVYWFSYRRRLIGISRVVFFEYATQFSMAGIYRDRDRGLMDELHASLTELHPYLTIPNPLRTEERDQRVEINLFMERFPLKEELQSDFVRAIQEVPELTFISP
ncbi:MAG: hypothetical protein ACUVRX_04090 [Actinomycetota bacterium]